MTTNPDSIVRVRARNGGRASVYEANGWAQAFSTGVMDGEGVRQNTSADMSVLVGGTTSNPDVVIAKNPADYKIALDIVGTHAVAITAPASNKRIASVVAYTDDLSIQSTETSVTGSPSTCGLIVVNGETSASPVPPDDTAIRAAITADGATGAQASYAVIADIQVDSSTSVITDTIITNHRSGVTSSHVDFTTFTGQTIDNDWVVTQISDGIFIIFRQFEKGLNIPGTSWGQYDQDAPSPAMLPDSEYSYSNLSAFVQSTDNAIGCECEPHVGADSRRGVRVRYRNIYGGALNQAFYARVSFIVVRKDLVS